MRPFDCLVLDLCVVWHGGHVVGRGSACGMVLADGG